MGIEYLGNKRQLEHFILDGIRKHTEENCTTCLDAFCGSGSISALLKRQGYSVTANDFMSFASHMTAAVLLNDHAPAFHMLVQNGIMEASHDTYALVLEYLNSLPGRTGFITRNYSPESVRYCDVERMYFTVENARRIDAIREKIKEWDPYLQENEKSLLLADLVEAVSSVSNIAGTYGCYMKHWKKKALFPLTLKMSTFIPGRAGAVYSVSNREVNEIIGAGTYDIVYADPPYTKRQYSAYYHLLETIVLWDEPALEGSTGLRDWKQKSSDFCYKRKAPAALQYLVEHVNCRYFVLSYSDEGQIPHAEIMRILSGRGSVRTEESAYKRYKSNNADNQRKDVVERIYLLKMR